MAEYRLYFMTDDGHIRQGMDLECEDDAHAVKVVKDRRDPGPLELWSGARVVARFPPGQSA